MPFHTGLKKIGVTREFRLGKNVYFFTFFHPGVKMFYKKANSPQFYNLRDILQKSKKQVLYALTELYKNYNFRSPREVRCLILK